MIQITEVTGLYKLGHSKIVMATHCKFFLVVYLTFYTLERNILFSGGNNISEIYSIYADGGRYSSVLAITW